ncbi:MAG: FixH family protein [Polyangiales bacterium]
MRIVLFFAVAVTACSSSGTDSTVDAAPEAAPSVCATDPRVQPFAAGLEAKTKSGLSLKILDATPAPPSKGDNAWNLALSDAGGAPVSGATITVKTWMPDHGHGSSIVPAVADSGGGKYALTRLNLFMPGIWEITFTIARGDTTETAMFTLCIST